MTAPSAAPVSRIVATTPQASHALGDRVRIAILEALSVRESSVDDLAQALKRRGIAKAVPTVRHHVDVLKEAGLVHLQRVEDVRGGTLKYYAANVRPLVHEPGPGFEDNIRAAVDGAEPILRQGIAKLLKQHPELRAIARDLRPCPHCNESHFLEYVLLQVVDRATARVLQSSGPSSAPNAALRRDP